MNQHADTTGFQEKILRVSHQLIQAIQSVFSELTPVPERPADLCRINGINKDLASKLLKAMRQPDPLATLFYMPGPESIHSLMRAINRLKGNRTTTRELNRSIKEFRELIDSIPGGRSSLLTILSATIPELKQKAEEASKQQLFKAGGSLRGITADLQIATYIVSPGTENDTLHTTLIHGWQGLKQIHPNATIMEFQPGFPVSKSNQMSLTNENPTLDNMLLEQSSIGSATDLKLINRKGSLKYQLRFNPHSLFIETRLFTGVFFANQVSQFQQDPGPDRHHFPVTVDLPVKWLIMDLMIHKNFWRKPMPRVDTFPHSSVHPIAISDPQSAINRVPLETTIHQLGLNPQRMAITHIPDYRRILTTACSARSSHPGQYRCYRCQVRYPVWQSDMAISVHIPERPATTEKLQPTLF